MIDLLGEPVPETITVASQCQASELRSISRTVGTLFLFQGSCEWHYPTRRQQTYCFLSKVDVWINKQLRSATVERNHHASSHFNIIVTFTLLLIRKVMGEVKYQVRLRSRFPRLKRCH